MAFWSATMFIILATITLASATSSQFCNEAYYIKSSYVDVMGSPDKETILLPGRMDKKQLLFWCLSRCFADPECCMANVVERGICTLMPTHPLRADNSTLYIKRDCDPKAHHNLLGRVLPLTQGQFRHPLERGTPADDGTFIPSYYMVWKEKWLNWQDASDKCSSLDANLVSIESKEEQDHITKFLKRDLLLVSLWTSGHFDENGIWKWTGPGLPVSYENWAQGEPNNAGGEEECLSLWIIKKYTWNDSICEAIFLCICEQPLD